MGVSTQKIVKNKDSTSLQNTLWRWLLLGWGIVLITALLVRPVSSIDEGRYLSAAWEMWLTHNFLVPHLNGAFYSHKPPLLFWLVNGMWHVTGPSVWSARFILSLIGFLNIALTYRIAQTMWPQQKYVAHASAWMMAGLIFFNLANITVKFDILLMSWVLLAHWSLYKARTEYASTRYWVVYVVSVASSLLTKGPVALIYLLAMFPIHDATPSSKMTKRHGYLLWISMILLGGLLAGMWFGLATAQAGKYYAYQIFFDQTAERFLNSENSAKSFLFYFLWLPVLMLPWTAWPSLWKKLPQVRHLKDEKLRYCLKYIGIVLLSFSLISSKQERYILSLLPFVILVFSRVLFTEEHNASDKLLQYIKWGYVMTLLILVGGLIFFSVKTDRKLEVIGQKIHSFAPTQVAYAQWYHGELNFLARLSNPVVSIERKDINAWLQKNPNGVVVAITKKNDPLFLPNAYPIYSASYRGKNTISLLINSKKT